MLMQMGLSKNNFPRTLISEFNTRGNLENPELWQKMRLWYYHKTHDYPDKIVMRFGMANKDKFIGKPSSLRFNNIASIQDCILALEQALVHLGKMQGDINGANFEYRLEKRQQAIKKIWEGNL